MGIWQKSVTLEQGISYVHLFHIIISYVYFIYIMCEVIYSLSCDCLRQKSNFIKKYWVGYRIKWRAWKPVWGSAAREKMPKMVSQSRCGEKAMEEHGCHHSVLDPQCVLLPLLPKGMLLLHQWELPTVSASLHAAFQCKGCGPGHMPIPYVLEKPQQWVSRICSTCLEFAPVSYGDL